MVSKAEYLTYFEKNMKASKMEDLNPEKIEKFGEMFLTYP